MRRSLAALGLLALALAGCSAPSDPGSEATQEALSLSPASDEIYRCLVAKGWEVTINWAGGVGITSDEVPPDQEDAYDRDSEACWAVQEARVDAMTTEEIAEVYEQELATRECLIDEGYTVDAPPSKQQYIDTFHTNAWMACGASNVARAMAKEEMWRAINEQCTQPSWSLGL